MFFKEQSEIAQNIIKWDSSRINAKRIENMVPLLMLNGISQKLKTIGIILESNDIQSAYILLRNVLENTIYLEYIHREESNTSCKAYVVSSALDQIDLLEKSNPNTAKGMQYKKEFNNETHIENLFEHDPEYYQLMMSNFEHYLSTDKFKEIYSKLKSNRRIKWYGYNSGTNSIEQLARDVEMSGLYQMFYRQASKYVHGKEILGYLSYSNNFEVDTKHKTPAGLKEAFTLIASKTTFICLENYVKNRVHSRLPEYKQWEKHQYQKTLAILEKSKE